MKCSLNIVIIICDLNYIMTIVIVSSIFSWGRRGDKQITLLMVLVMDGPYIKVPMAPDHKKV